MLIYDTVFRLHKGDFVTKNSFNRWVLTFHIQIRLRLSMTNSINTHLRLKIASTQHELKNLNKYELAGPIEFSNPQFFICNVK